MPYTARQERFIRARAAAGEQWAQQAISHLHKIPKSKRRRKKKKR